MQLEFFNTIQLPAKPLFEATENASKQGGRILDIMKDGQKRTPLEVARVYNQMYPNVPDTSIRRAITVLTDQKKLVMLDEMTKEKYGYPNHLWIISE